MLTASDWADWPTWHRISKGAEMWEAERKWKRQLNRLFVTKVLGQREADIDQDYTASLDAAWGAAAPRFTKRHTGFVLWRSSGGWYAGIGAREATRYEAFADTPAEALMLSCLRAVGVEGGEEIARA